MIVFPNNGDMGPNWSELRAVEGVTRKGNEVVVSVDKPGAYELKNVVLNVTQVEKLHSELGKFLEKQAVVPAWRGSL